mgnify:CR=1 FL=1
MTQQQETGQKGREGLDLHPEILKAIDRSQKNNQPYTLIGRSDGITIFISPYDELIVDRDGSGENRFQSHERAEVDYYRSRLCAYIEHAFPSK